MVNLHKNSGQKFKSQEEKTMENSISIPENNTNVNSNSTKKVSLLKKIKCLGYNILLHKKLEPFLILNKLSKDVYNPYFDIDYKVSNMWCSYEKLKYNLNFRKKLLKSENEFEKVQELYSNDNPSLIFQLLHAVTVVIELFCTTNYSNPYTDGRYHTPSDYYNWDSKKNKGWSFFVQMNGSNPTILLMEQRVLFRILACENTNEYFELSNKYPFDVYKCFNKVNPNLEHTLYKMYVEENFDVDFRDISFLSIEEKFTLIRLELLKRGYLFGNSNHIKSEYNDDYNILCKKILKKIEKSDYLKNTEKQKNNIEIIQLMETYSKNIIDFILNAKKLKSKLKKLNLNITNNIIANNTSLRTIDSVEWNMNFNYQDFLNNHYTFEEKEIIFNNLKPIFKDFFSKQLGAYIIEEKKRQRYIVFVYYSLLITIERKDKFSLLEFDNKPINLNNDNQKEIILERLDTFAWFLRCPSDYDFIKGSQLVSNNWKNAIIKHHKFENNSGIRVLPFSTNTKIIYYKKTKDVPVSNDIYL